MDIRSFPSQGFSHQGPSQLAQTHIVIGLDNEGRIISASCYGSALLHAVASLPKVEKDLKPFDTDLESYQVPLPQQICSIYSPYASVTLNGFLLNWVLIPDLGRAEFCQHAQVQGGGAGSSAVQ